MNNKNSVKTVVAVAIGAARAVLCARPLCGDPQRHSEYEHQPAICGARSAGGDVRPGGGRPDRLYRPTLIDLSWGGSPWWSWVIASTFVGIVVGLFAKKLNVNEGEFSKKDVVTYAIANVIAHAVAWIGVAPVLDILIYAEPVDKVFAQGAMAAVANILTAVIVGALLIAAYTKTIAKKGSLEKQ